MSNVIVYTIDKENMVVDQMECDREWAMENYWNKRTTKGRYLIANITDDIPYKFRRKPLKDINFNSSSNQ